jgi:hypothetical protein
MLFAIREPVVLAGLVLGFVASCLLRVTVTRVVLHGPATWSPSQWVDPFGAVAAALCGIGWSPRQEASWQRRYRPVPVVAVPLAVGAALTAAGLAGFVAAGGALDEFIGTVCIPVWHGSVAGLTRTQELSLAFAVEALGCGLLSLVPVPPLELGVALWSSGLPRTPGARRVAYHLLHEQWGTAVLLVLLIVPLVGEEPLLLSLVDAVGNAILQAL